MSDVTRVEKPWGYELHWAKTDRYVGKLIHVNKGHALSLQYHNVKDETIFLWSGKLLFEIEVDGQLIEPRDAAGRGRARHAENGAPHDRASKTPTSSKSRRRSSTTSSALKTNTDGRTRKRSQSARGTGEVRSEYGVKSA